MKHSFAGLTFDGFFIGPLRCSNCGLWVGARAARQLEGLKCK